MTTRVTKGARRERHRPRFARIAASPLPRACTALTKCEVKERLLAVYWNKEAARDKPHQLRGPKKKIRALIV